MGKTIGEHVKSLAEEFPSRDIHVFYDANMKRTSITFQELYTLGSRFAHILRANGVKAGDSVCIALPTSIELAVAFYGAMFAGAKVVSCEASPGKVDVFFHCITKSEAKLLIARTDPSDDTWQHIKDHVTGMDKENPMVKICNPKVPSLKNVMIVSRNDNGVQGFLPMLRAYKDSFETPDYKDTDTCSMWLTSGTTGMPKLVCKSHRTFTIESVVERGFITPATKKRIFTNTPWSWIVSSPFDVMDGTTRVQPESWTPKPDNIFKWLVDILKVDGVDNAFLTPPEIDGMHKYWDVKDRKMINFLCVAGYQISYNMCAHFMTIVNNVFVRYGCSELISISSNLISDPKQYKDFDCGKLCQGSTLKAVDENMKEVPKGTPGRLMVRNVGVFDGYMNEPAKTKEALTDDGWFLTSDAGYIDDNDHLIVIGRYDYVIKHKDLLIYPSTIEKPIQMVPGVKTVVVVPVPNETNHHNVCACIVRAPGSQVTEAEIKKAVADKCNDGFKNLVEPHHVVFIEEITVNERGKMNTNGIIDYAIKQINAIKIQ